MGMAAAAGAGLLLIGAAVRYAGGFNRAVQSANEFVIEVGGKLMPTGIDLKNENLRAFLSMIRHAEGTDQYSAPYRVRFGGELVAEGLKTHPGGVVCRVMKGRRICSSAAGAYQFLKETWDWIAPDLDFSTAAGQDEAAARLIRYRGALGDVYAGNFANAVRKCRLEWASLPGAGYGQPEKALAELQGVFVAAGGRVGVA